MKMRNKRIFFIDPQSMKNLSIYDYGVLSEIKSEVTYICSKYYDYLPMRGNITFKKLFSYNNIKNPIVKVLSYLLSYIRIFILIYNEKPILIHVQWLRLHIFDYIFYLSIKHLFKLKLVYTAHNLLPLNHGMRYRWIFNKIYKLFDSIIVHSEKTKQEMLSLFHICEGKVYINHHGILRMEYNKVAYKIQSDNYQNKYSLSDKIVFTSLGEQSYYKAIDLIVDVWRSTPELYNNNNIKLLIVGKHKGIDFHQLDNISNVLVEDRKIPNEEFIFLLRHTDVYLLPYRTISQSGALFTALAEHVPVLVSDAGGLSEPLSIAKVGWKIKSNDYEDLKKQLLYLSQNIKEIKEVKKNEQNWNKVCKEYEWRVISLRMAFIYECTLSH